MSARVPAPSGVRTYPRSPVVLEDSSYCLAQDPETLTRFLVVHGNVHGFDGTRDDSSATLLCPLNAVNAKTLRSRLPWLRPVPLGLKTSAGFGDRLGMATPGHVRAIRRLPEGAGSIAAIFAQQSVRENSRTGRTPQQVIDDALWGLLQEGWSEPWGADADHLKTTSDIDEFTDAGYTLFTVDPGDHVDDTVQTSSAEVLSAKFQALPWDLLEDTPADLRRRYLSAPVDLDGSVLAFEDSSLVGAAVKYGRAIAHTVALYRYLGSRMDSRPFELEVSVDETSSPTTVAEHVYIASELNRLGVRWVSLAPRFVGRFEKGVDYIGDLDIFSSTLAQHVAVSRVLGPYKLSLHSGSDKFSVYPIVARLTDGASLGFCGPLVHVKTAGTSYLEALRAVARVEGGLFREILAFAKARYETDRVTYHVSASAARIPTPPDSSDLDLTRLLDQFDTRQALHVTFGSVLETYGDRLLQVLRSHEETYTAMLEDHFTRHLAPFVT